MTPGLIRELFNKALYDELLSPNPDIKKARAYFGGLEGLVAIALESKLCRGREKWNAIASDETISNAMLCGCCKLEHSRK